jgi:hypothetical protein
MSLSGLRAWHDRVAVRVLLAASLVVVWVAAAPSGQAAAASNWAPNLVAGGSGQAQSQATPAAPTSATATCTSALVKTVDVTWTAVARATSYTIYQSNSSTSGYSAAATGVTATSWTSPSLAIGNYWYEVTAYIGTNWISTQSSATAQRTIVVGCT